eukprot:CAMPEP_0116133982 /NCGR_PEP_ID=MMETSP0329-20121206/10403_1 /TAXON_ID=697910 /ORGANISM="Pseudo-nitzschia arenysensis, Strain B593" /LENGTH=134 /DNA_ID=CAMNT_0003628663 /DNA_START=451 /DNA_END=855 /DNA_ORIENTATION=-
MSDLEDVDVIDWDEAMQQCGDDEEFLRELLGDLREETDSQMAQMDEIIKNIAGNSFIGIVRAAHVIKGAASNLMCEQLRRTAMELETKAQDFDKEKQKDKEKDFSENWEIVKKKLSNLKVAVANYHEYLEEVDV